jgi:hypothetical protein
MGGRRPSRGLRLAAVSGMTKLHCLLAVMLLSVGTGACNRSPTDVPSATVDDAATTADVGTNVGQPESPAPNVQGTEDAQQDREALPSTASPLAVAGLLGLLSLGGAIAVRFLGRL